MRVQIAIAGLRFDSHWTKQQAVSTTINDGKATAQNNIQLFPEGEVNSGGYIPRREASRYISTALHRS